MTARRKSLLDPADSHWDRQVQIDGWESWTHFNRDDVRRLMRGTRMLEQLLKRSLAEDLPALTWTVTTSGSLVGELSTIGGPDPAGCRESFMAWVQALELERHEFGQPNAPEAWWNERRHGGEVELRGARKMPALKPDGHLDVCVSVRAFWWDHEETPDAASMPTETSV